MDFIKTLELIKIAVLQDEALVRPPPVPQNNLSGIAEIAIHLDHEHEGHPQSCFETRTGVLIRQVGAQVGAAKELLGTLRHLISCFPTRRSSD